MSLGGWIYPHIIEERCFRGMMVMRQESRKAAKEGRPVLRGRQVHVVEREVKGGMVAMEVLADMVGAADMAHRAW